MKTRYFAIGALVSTILCGKIIFGDATRKLYTGELIGQPTLTITNGGGTLSLPSSTDNLVGRNTSDTLTNKTISGASNTFQQVPAASVTSTPSGNLSATDAQSALNELQSDIDTRATSSALTTHTSASSGVHGVTGSVVGTSDSQTLTNKTISGASNTITNISGSNVANTPSGNLAATDSQSALNELQSDIDTRATSGSLTSHTGASSGVHGVTGSVVGTTDSQTLSSKTLAVGSNSITSTLDRAAQFNASTGNLEPSSTVSNTELGYSDGVTSSLCGINQSCTLTNKTINTASNTIVGSPSMVAVYDGASTLTYSSTVDSTELNNLNGVASQLYGANDSGTFTNKTLAVGSNSITGTLDRAAQFNASTGALEASSAVSNTELGYVDGVTSSLCGINQSCTETNKTLAVGSNSITSTLNRAAQFNSSTGNLEPSSTVDNTELGRLDGVAGSIYYSGGTDVAIADGGTGQSTATAGFNALDPLTTKGDIITHDGTDSVRLGVGTDGYALVADSTQSTGIKWGQVAGGGAEAQNYATNNDTNFDTTVGTWTTYADGSATPVDGQNGSPTLTAVRSTSSPLHGAGNLLITPGALGNGAAFSFTLNRRDIASVMEVNFPIEIGTYASFTDGDIGIYAISASDSGYTTNLEVTQLAPYKVLKASGQEIWKGIFQTHASNTYYKICLHQVTSATGYTLKVDDFYVGPQKSAPTGAVITDLQTFSAPTYGGIGTNYTDHKYQYWRVGSNLKVQIGGQMTSTVSTTIKIPLPAGLSIDTTKYPTNADDMNPIGIARAMDLTGASNEYFGIVIPVPSDPTYVYLRKDAGGGAAGAWNASTPFTWASGDRFGFEFEVPILGWSSNTLMSSDSGDQRVVAFRALGAPPTASANPDATVRLVTFGTELNDTSSVYDNTTGVFTAQSPGYYSATAQVETSGTYASAGDATRVYLRKNYAGSSTDLVQNFYRAPVAQTASSRIPVNMNSIYLNAGDTLTIHCSSEASTTSYGSTTGASFSS